jgi:putative LysE/RhtB family amino acid efflux pump
VAVFAALGGVSIKGGEIFVMIFGVFCGSLSWWLILSGAVARLRHKLSARAMSLVKITSGIILAAFGLYAFLKGAIAHFFS